VPITLAVALSSLGPPVWRWPLTWSSHVPNTLSIICLGIGSARVKVSPRNHSPPAMKYKGVLLMMSWGEGLLMFPSEGELRCVDLRDLQPASPAVAPHR
jgi:hypothetical protein